MHSHCLQRSGEVLQHFCAQDFDVSESPEQSGIKRKKQLLQQYLTCATYALTDTDHSIVL